MIFWALEGVDAGLMLLMSGVIIIFFLVASGAVIRDWLTKKNK